MSASVTLRVLLPALVLGVSACTPVGAPGVAGQASRPCFLVSQVSGFSEGARRDGRVYLRVGLRDAYEVDVVGACPDLDWSYAIGVDRRFGGPSRCVGDLVDLVVPTQAPGDRTDRCLARVTRKLTDDERQQLIGR